MEEEVKEWIKQNEHMLYVLMVFVACFFALVVVISMDAKRMQSNKQEFIQYCLDKGYTLQDCRWAYHGKIKLIFEKESCDE